MLRKMSLVLFLLFFFSSCGRNGEKNTGHENNPDLSASPFPHSKAWADPKVHGKFVLDNGMASCQNSCHESASGESAGPKCSSCHIFPHTANEEWINAAGHAEFVRQKGSEKVFEQCATACHGQDLLGGYDPHGKKSCVRCHKSYPLPHQDKQKWINGEHDRFILQEGGKEPCQLCHGADLMGGVSKVVCYPCHDPGGIFAEHSAGGVCDLSLHGKVYRQKKSDCKTACHANDGTGGITERSCMECHKSFPLDHERDYGLWQTTGHGQYVKNSGDDAQCEMCHHARAENELPLKLCIDCHPSYPKMHREQPEAWVNAVHSAELNLEGIAACQMCHDVRNECKSCHHENKVDWEATTHQQVPRAGLSGCRACHGNVHDVAGGVVQVSCIICHREHLDRVGCLDCHGGRDFNAQPW